LTGLETLTFRQMKRWISQVIDAADLRGLDNAAYSLFAIMIGLFPASDLDQMQEKSVCRWNMHEHATCYLSPCTQRPNTANNMFFSVTVHADTLQCTLLYLRRDICICSAVYT
jgi:hypothetical protein